MLQIISYDRATLVLITLYISINYTVPSTHCRAIPKSKKEARGNYNHGSKQHKLFTHNSKKQTLSSAAFAIIKLSKQNHEQQTDRPI